MSLFLLNPKVFGAFPVFFILKSRFLRAFPVFPYPNPAF